MAEVLSVNTGKVQPFIAGRARTSAIVKTPVAGVVEVAGVHVGDDEQANTSVHGGIHQAVYAYARESYEWWEDVLGRELEPGLFGENLTTLGVDVDGALIGERWRVGSAVIEVTSPRIPCLKFAKRMDDLGWIKQFGIGRRPGAYFRIIEPGAVAAGDLIEVVSRPDHEVSIKLVNEALVHDNSLAQQLLPALDALPPKTRDWVRRKAA
jgi:MOSC domain-containing protein YiiM